MTTAAERWAGQLAEWAIPEEIMAQAPEPPWAFLPSTFRAPTGPTPDTPSRRRGREALPEGGSVLDVGCGGGAAGFALVPPAGRVTGFDQGDDLLEVFKERAVELGVEHEAVQGSWPDDAGLVGPADVVVTNHVIYNVPGIAAFAAALTTHARNRVVVEMSAEHPRAGVNHLWRHFWDLERPTGPDADDAIAALVEAGIEPQVERFEREPRSFSREARVASVRRYLCLPASREREVDALLGDAPARSARVVTLWWDGSA